MKNLRAFLGIAALVLVGGCDSATDVEDGVSGSVSFTYTGGGGGTYNAVGAMPPRVSSSAYATPWAAGWRDALDVWVAGNLPTSGSRVNSAALIIKRQTEGSVTVAGPCVLTSPTCSALTLSIGLDPQLGSFSQACVMTSGTITISTISTTSVTGTFSGSGTCVASPAGTSSAFTVSTGSFNVPLVTAFNPG